MNSLVFLPFSFKLCLGIFKHQHFELWWKTKYWHQSIAVSFIYRDFYTYDYVVYAFYGLFISILYSHWSPFNSQQSIFSRIYSACRWHNVDGVALLIFRPCTTASMINIIIKSVVCPWDAGFMPCLWYFKSVYRERQASIRFFWNSFWYCITNSHIILYPSIIIYFVRVNTSWNYSSFCKYCTVSYCWNNICV